MAWPWAKNSCLCLQACRLIWATLSMLLLMMHFLSFLFFIIDGCDNLRCMRRSSKFNNWGLTLQQLHHPTMVLESPAAIR
ncbi:hypothetical protein I7I53_10704 [Histoplasma capsulatum var. duboisii H88]|uniref:Uncharacterized protein n=1 Tax=Ajellomyces capsulatus (strain H88) TaxID=544711 RepID=A0A8A1LEA1_AJEC8|nr:hypothetical protein I7I53_10704 [Histoplasma capsulatum var. duboisii H88]